MAQKPLPEDFRDFIESLNSNEVEYILIGGWAVGLHGNPRPSMAGEEMEIIEELK